MNARKKISSDFTLLFQAIVVLKFISFTILSLILSFFFDYKTNLLLLGFWILAVLLLKTIGIYRLRTLHCEDQALLIGKKQSLRKIPLNSILAIKRTFLFDYFLFKIKFKHLDSIQTLYFLPKSKVFQDFYSYNEVIENLKDKTKAAKNR